MADAKKAEASRANGARSRGPKTDAGKSRSSQNAATHGVLSLCPVLPGEPAEAWAAHRAGITESLAPAGLLEQELADRIALCLWRLKRVAAYEAGTVAANIGDVFDAPADDAALSPTHVQAEAVRQRLAASERLAAALRLVQTWAGPHSLFQRLDGMADDERLDAEHVSGVLYDVLDLVPVSSDPEEGFDLDDAAFTAALGIPQGRPVHEWEGWTAGKLRHAVQLIAFEFRDDQARLLATARSARAACMVRMHADVERKEEELAGREQEASNEAARQEEGAARQARRKQRQHQREAARSCMLDAPSLDKVMRYEAHLNRQLISALHALQRLQALRAGQDVPPPVAVGVNVDS
jgi:hypothetical protein